MTRPVTSAVFVTIAMLVFAVGWFAGRLPPVVRPSGPSLSVMPASVAFKCGDGTIYTVSTGTQNGECTAHKAGAACTDGDNVANANCTDGCTRTKGAGSCTIK
jgi:hypothetical protein